MVQTVSRELDRDEARFSIGEVAERTGLSQHTLRWYERIGLMAYVDRDHAGQRRFTERDLSWLELIGRLRTTGMSVADMLHYAELVRAGESTFPERLAMFRQTREDVLAKIAELQQTIAVLDQKIAVYAASGAGDDEGKL